LAQWALHQTYDKKEFVPTGPLYKSHNIKGNTVHISFDHVGKGLMIGKKTKLEPTAEVKSGELQHFAIAGEDKKWVWAKAAIDGDTVIVKSKEVTNPVAVRYGFTMNPANANLYNKDGIAASPFRTDDW
jgi:sialate O-acetylesterase